ncbi:hypothetical protein J6590_087510 [Homalodisca vitripennis]|nr:hypothetical protein J6590_087510 [Homalodisca vitripennis]
MQLTKGVSAGKPSKDRWVNLRSGEIRIRKACTVPLCCKKRSLPLEGGSSTTQASMIKLESSFPLLTDYSTDLAVSLEIHNATARSQKSAEQYRSHVEPSDVHLTPPSTTLI